MNPSPRTSEDQTVESWAQLAQLVKRLRALPKLPSVEVRDTEEIPEGVDALEVVDQRLHRNPRASEHGGAQVSG